MMLQQWFSPEPRRYLWILFACGIGTALMGAFNYLLLARSFELASPREIAELQRESGAIYGPATAEAVKAGAELKSQLYLARQPDVVVVGSSRALRFREAFFSAPFFNLGGTIQQPADSTAAISALFQQHRPKMVILLLDFWWFTPESSIRRSDDRIRQRNIEPQRDAMGNLIQLHSRIPDLFQPIQFLFEGRLSIDDLWRIVFNRPRDRDAFPLRLGMVAFKQASGLGSDGSSYHDTGIVYGWTRSEDFQFQRTRELIARHYGGFECADRPDDLRFAHFETLLKAAQDTGATVLTVVPPLAGTVLDLMAKEGDCYNYITDLRQRLPNANTLHFDYHDMRPMGVTDCEFLDGYHPGDVIDARILLDITNRTRPMEQFVDKAALVHAINEYSGRAFISRGFGDRRYKEIDFLGLGNCPEKAHEPAPAK